MLQLTQYPDAIAAAERHELQMARDVRILKETELQLIAAVERQVAQESAAKILTNDQQRKARKQELLEANPDHAMIVRQLQVAEEDLAEMRITVNLLRNQFAVLKLEARDRIASKEAVAA